MLSSLGFLHFFLLLLRVGEEDLGLLTLLLTAPFFKILGNFYLLLFRLIIYNNFFLWGGTFSVSSSTFGKKCYNYLVKKNSDKPTTSYAIFLK